MLARDLARSLDPIEFAVDAGLDPDEWQRDLLIGDDRKILLNCCRQSGKSTTAAMLALHDAFYSAPSLTILISPSQRQSTELFRKVATFYHHVEGAPEAELESALRLELKNGSRIVSLPGSEATVRGYSAANTVVIDEASRVPDDLIAAVRPMLATTRGRMIGLSTPYGKRGWFYETWENGADWKKVRITADDCPRITPEFLEDERREMGEWLFRQEYYCEFVDTEEQFFSSAVIEAALKDTGGPLWSG
ncbi:terminase large subunit domain-containing protein [Ferruginivarius sediminum]|uniref:Terminase n=1 Tax=Ferruginivarius sediminum TaxID=2661937 RepID=A0A369TCS8_9PROT|nr:terminase family protein [Ferruginivarius sediminum]RDD62622.1 terminase [Ferruginivarius sediminum]